MPKRIPENVPLPLPAIDLIQRWGKSICAQRQSRKIHMRDFSHRINVSLNTLQRVERGEHSVQVGTYLSAMITLGILDKLCPSPDPSLMQSSVKRVRKSIAKGEDDYF